MKGIGKSIKRGILLGCSLFLCMSQTVFAEEDTATNEPYTYTVTFYAGNQGSFIGADSIEAPGYATKNVTGDKDKITVTGLKYDDEIRVYDVGSMLNLKDGKKYYVPSPGIRKSGRDNSEAVPRFKVESDMEYVVAYGIRGNMVAYTVNYQDESGNTLYSSATYYGNVGDEVVVAYRYIENYQPEAYNEKKTLTENEADNVFTFKYRQIPAAETNGDETGGADGTTGEEGNAGTDGTPGTDGTAGQTNDQAGNPGTIGNDEGTQTIEPTETPQDLISLDDEETPKASLEGLDDSEKAAENRMAVYVTIAIIAVLALAALITVIMRKRRNV